MTSSEYPIETLDEAGKKAPKLYGIPSGVDGLDNLFFTAKIEGDEVKQIPLGGYPAGAIINLTGIPETGKSLMAEQFAVKQASLGNNFCFITVESPSPYIAQGIRQRATAMKIDWDKIKDKIVLIDAATHRKLREDIRTLLNTLNHAIKTYKIRVIAIDSVTGLYEAREMMARTIVREIFNFLKQHRVTALLISQKRSSHEETSAEAAGGYAVSHICDCTIVLTKFLIHTKTAQNIYKKPIGSIIRTIRIDGCRLCGHDTSTHLLEITPTGLVKVKEPLERLVST